MSIICNIDRNEQCPPVPFKRPANSVNSHINSPHETITEKKQTAGPFEAE